MRKELVTTLALCITILAVTLVYATLVSTRIVSNVTGVSSIGVEVFRDSNCTTTLPSINWGLLEPGSAHNTTMYMRNSGTVPAILSLTSTNWNPANATTYITVTWDKQGFVLGPSLVTQTTVTLSVAYNVTGISSITFDLIVTGTS